MNTTQLGGTIILSYDRIRSHDRSSLWRLPKLRCYVSQPANATRTNSVLIFFSGTKPYIPSCTCLFACFFTMPGFSVFQVCQVLYGLQCLTRVGPYVPFSSAKYARLCPPFHVVDMTSVRVRKSNCLYSLMLTASPTALDSKNEVDCLVG